MTFKIVNGLVGPSPRAQNSAQSQAQEASRASVSQQMQVVRTPVSDAVTTTIFTTVRKGTAGDRLPSYENARDVAKSVARSIKEKGDTEAHQGIEDARGASKTPHYLS